MRSYVKAARSLGYQNERPMDGTACIDQVKRSGSIYELGTVRRLYGPESDRRRIREGAYRTMG
jgi:hypothetical protein